jgi:uncharacterized membrane protein YwaF
LFGAGTFRLFPSAVLDGLLILYPPPPHALFLIKTVLTAIIFSFFTTFINNSGKATHAFLQAQPNTSSLQEFHEDFPKLQFLENLP